MSLLSQLMQQGASSLMQDPTAQQRTQLNGLCAHPALAGQDIGITDLLSSVQSKMAVSLSDMDMKLPMMGAHETMQKRMGVLDGQYPGTDGGSQFNQVFQDVTQGPTLLSSLHSKLTQLLNNAPPPVTLPDGTVQPSPAIEEAKTLVSQANTDFSVLSQGSISAFAGVQQAVSDYAFLSFLTMRHSPAVQRILSSIVPEIPAGLKQEQDMLASSSACLAQPSVLSADTLTNKEQTLQPQQMAPSLFQQLKSSITSAKDNFNVQDALLLERSRECVDWQESNGYSEARRNKDSSPEAAAHWEQLQQRYKTEVFSAYNSQRAIRDAARDNYAKSRSDYTTQLRSE